MEKRPRIANRTRIDEQGVEWRCCHVCEIEKTLEEYRSLGPERKTGICNECRKKRQRRYYAEGRLTIDKARQLEAERRSRKRNAERRRKQAKEYRERLKADPVRYTRFLETRRIQARLKAEREGRPPVTRIVKARSVREEHYLPALPLAAFVDAKIEQRCRIDRNLGLGEDLAPFEEICHDLGIATKSLRDWRNGIVREVQVGTAERVLLNANASLDEVWLRSEFPELYNGGVLSEDGPRCSQCGYKQRYAKGLCSKCYTESRKAV